MRSIVVLTGAGISAESGVQTFRGAGGLWEGHRVEDVATPEAFAKNPSLVQNFYNERRRALLDGVEPNPAHRALARLQEQGKVLLVTQNIDDLHERGGSQRVLHMHGELLKARCLFCDAVSECRVDLTANSSCETCSGEGGLRPHIVWFGEMPFYIPEIERALSTADLFLSVGTSGRVYPAAGFVNLADLAGAEKIEVNLEETASSSSFDRSLHGPAGEVLPCLVDEILAGKT